MTSRSREIYVKERNGGVTKISRGNIGNEQPQ